MLPLVAVSPAIESVLVSLSFSIVTVLTFLKSSGLSLPPQPESVQCFLIASPGLGFWQTYRLTYAVLSASRQEACDVTVPRRCQCSPCH